MACLIPNNFGSSICVSVAYDARCNRYSTLTPGSACSPGNQRVRLPPRASQGRRDSSKQSPLVAAMSSQAVAANVRVASYNILSSKLARKDHFCNCAEDALSAHARLPRILAKIDAEVARGAVVCLQEVPMEWAGELHTFFQQRDYHFLLSLYGSPFNGYMGVGVAFCTTRFLAVDMNLERLSDTRRWAFPPKDGPLKKVVKVATKPVVTLFGWGEGAVRAVLRLPKERETDEWMYSRGRQNTVAFVRLRCRTTNSVFCVATYHMPCAFWAPKVMTIHTALLGQHMKKMAKADPYVLAGDFNFKPNSLCYKLMTKGEVDPTDPEYEMGNPIKPEYDMSNWMPNIAFPLRSAYVEMNGSEPDFTNHAQIKDMEPFIEALDYIFLSPEWRVQNVLPLSHRDAVKGPYPTVEEPSDHVLIAALLSLRV